MTTGGLWVEAPGQVVIGAASHAALAGRRKVTALGPLQIKGKAEPVDACALIDDDDAAPTTGGDRAWPVR